MKRIYTFAFVCFLAVPSILSAATRTWTGAVNGNWAEGGNWSGGTAPVSGDDLVFGPSPNQSVFNDLPPGAIVHTMTFSSAYTVGGNTVSLSGGLSTSGGGSVSFVTPISIQASQAWSGQLRLGGSGIGTSVDLGPYTLTFNTTSAELLSPIWGTGGIVVNGALTFWGIDYSTGPTVVNASGVLNCGGLFQGPITLAGTFSFQTPRGQNEFAGTNGTFTSTGGVINMGDGGGKVGSLFLDSATRFNVTYQPTPAGNAGLTIASPGKVSLGNAHLNFSLQFTPPTGTFFLFINNFQSLSGTFAGLPEGARLTGTQQITYHGGIYGNEIRITIVPNQILTSTSLGVTPNPAFAAQPVTLTANVSASGGTGPLSGTVTFYDQSTPIGSAPVAGGTASMTTSSLAPGSHNLSATFIPATSEYFGSSSPTVVEVVNAISTETALVVRPNPTYVGGKTTLIASITAAGGTPTGSVTFYDGTVALLSEPLTGGLATAVVGPLARGRHAITAAYAPDVAAFLSSTSRPVELLVDVPAVATTTTLEVTPERSSRGQAVTLTATVTSDSGPPFGNVIFSDGDAILDSQPPNGGTVSISRSTLGVGQHTLRATFVPATSSFMPSTSTEVVHTVVDTNVRRRAAGGH